jgi:hypothetical protein
MNKGMQQQRQMLNRTATRMEELAAAVVDSAMGSGGARSWSVTFVGAAVGVGVGEGVGIMAQVNPAGRAPGRPSSRGKIHSPLTH